MTYNVEKTKGENLLDYTAHFRIYGSFIHGYIFKAHLDIVDKKSCTERPEGNQRP